MADDDAPRVGQIVEHHFLWADEHTAGQLEGRKPRPCLIIAVEPRRSGGPRVTVLPITSQAPRQGTTAVAIPGHLKVRLGLDHARPAWIVIDDANVFTWPGFDLVPQPGGSFVRAVVTRGLFRQVRSAVLAVHARGRPRRVERDEC
jgi:hypothetical protein